MLIEQLNVANKPFFNMCHFEANLTLSAVTDCINLALPRLARKTTSTLSRLKFTEVEVISIIDAGRCAAFLTHAWSPRDTF